MFRIQMCSMVVMLLLNVSVSRSQSVLTLTDALSASLANYGSIQAKGYQVEASKATLAQTRREYLPNVVLSAQQNYGTINGQNGPLYGLGGYGVASSGLPLPEQNWNAAFGALYLANVNWEVFTFGRARESIKVAEAGLTLIQNDLAQEQFQHQVRVSAAYLNALATQRLVKTQQKNLERAMVFKSTVVARAKNGLIAGVDSSLANAEVSNARIAFIKARDREQEELKKLAVLIGITGTDFILDSSFVSRVPVITPGERAQEKEHPVLRFYKSRIAVSEEQTKLIRRSFYPSFTLFGVWQQRASGFEAAYAQDQTAFTHDYRSGITPTRTNYLIGAGLVWNITTVSRSHARARAQQFTALSNQQDYELVDEQLKAQYAIAEEKLRNALLTYQEAPVQVRSATEAYKQKNVLYQNGLTTVVDVTQTLYAINRAETDRDIAYINLWQAVLLKAAASGDLELFTKEL